jgi:hypothetical protein
MEIFTKKNDFLQKKMIFFEKKTIFFEKYMKYTKKKICMQSQVTNNIIKINIVIDKVLKFNKWVLQK